MVVGSKPTSDECSFFLHRSFVIGWRKTSNGVLCFHFLRLSLCFVGYWSQFWHDVLKKNMFSIWIGRHCRRLNTYESFHLSQSLLFFFCENIISDNKHWYNSWLSAYLQLISVILIMCIDLHYIIGDDYMNVSLNSVINISISTFDTTTELVIYWNSEGKTSLDGSYSNSLILIHAYHSIVFLLVSSLILTSFFVYGVQYVCYLTKTLIIYDRRVTSPTKRSWWFQYSLLIPPYRLKICKWSAATICPWLSIYNHS